MEAGQGLEDHQLIGDTPVYVNFFAEFHPQSTRALMTVMSECAERGAEEVHLLISTPGGGVHAGIAAYNLLLGLPFKLVTHNTGNVASIGVAVYLAGAERLTCKNSTFFLHGVKRGVDEGEFEARWFREALDAMKASETKINAILAERTDLTKTQLAAFAQTEETKNAKEAVEVGIAHHVKDVEIPQGAIVHTVGF